MPDCFRQAPRFRCFLEHKGFHGFGVQAGERDLLCPGHCTNTQEQKQECCFPLNHSANAKCRHNVSEGSTWPLVLVLMECRWLENGPSVPLGAFGPKREEVTKVTISICGHGTICHAGRTNAADARNKRKASGTEEHSGRIRATPALNCTQT